MKIQILSFFVIILLFTSCNLAQKEPGMDIARVSRTNGLLVFINSEPLNSYEVIGRLKHDAVAETLRKGKGKKFGEAFGAILESVVENTTLQEQLYKMVELAKDKNPDAEAIIINNKMFEAQVIKFN